MLDRMYIRLPATLKAALVRDAEKRELTLSAYVIYCLRNRRQPRRGGSKRVKRSAQQPGA